MKRMILILSIVTALMLLVTACAGDDDSDVLVADDTDDVEAIAEADDASEVDQPTPAPTATPEPTPAPTATSEPTPEPSPTPEPTPEPEGPGTRDNPIPIGEAAWIDDWEVRVLNVMPDGTEEVLAANQFNDPPDEGKQFFLAEVRATYHGPDSDRFDGSYRLRTVGTENVSYSSFSHSCGVVPDPLPDPEVFTGGTISGNICWQISMSEADSLMMFDDHFGSASERSFMALYDDGNVVEPPRPLEPEPPAGGEPGDRGNPIPIGTQVDLGDGWLVTVQSVTMDGIDEVLAANQFNDPPFEGHQFFIARVEATYAGEGSSRFDGSYRLRVVGTQAVAYSTFSNSCGVSPDPLEDPEVFGGGSISGNLCWEVRTSDAESLVMFDDAFLTEAERVYLALH